MYVLSLGHSTLVLTSHVNGLVKLLSSFFHSFILIGLLRALSHFEFEFDLQLKVFRLSFLGEARYDTDSNGHPLGFLLSPLHP